MHTCSWNNIDWILKLLKEQQQKKTTATLKELYLSGGGHTMQVTTVSYILDISRLWCRLARWKPFLMNILYEQSHQNGYWFQFSLWLPASLCKHTKTHISKLLIIRHRRESCRLNLSTADTPRQHKNDLKKEDPHFGMPQSEPWPKSYRKPNVNRTMNRFSLCKDECNKIDKTNCVILAHSFPKKAKCFITNYGAIAKY